MILRPGEGNAKAGQMPLGEHKALLVRQPCHSAPSRSDLELACRTSGRCAAREKGDLCAAGPDHDRLWIPAHDFLEPENALIPSDGALNITYEYLDMVYGLDCECHQCLHWCDPPWFVLGRDPYRLASVFESAANDKGSSRSA